MAKAAIKRKKTKAKNSKFTDPEQSERFIATARELGIEETGADFDRVLEKLLPPKARKSKAP